MIEQLIKKKDILERYACPDPAGTFVQMSSLYEFVRDLPVVRVYPDRERGEWIGNPRHQACSVCHTTYCIPDGMPGTLDMTSYKYCPNCGAYMRG